MQLNNNVSIPFNQVNGWVGKDFKTIQSEIKEILTKQGRIFQSVGLITRAYNPGNSALFFTDKKNTPIARFDFEENGEVISLRLLDLKTNTELKRFEHRFTIAIEKELEKVFKELV